MCASHGERAAIRSTGCDLCGLPVLGRPIREESHSFCCEGCRRVWTLARDSGLDSVLDSSADRALRARDASQRKARAAAAAGARRRTLRVEGMWCSSCSLVLEDALLALDGVLDAEVSYAAGLARVTWDPQRTDLETVQARIERLGYRVGSRALDGHRDDVDDLFLRMFVGAVVGMWVMWPTIFLLWPGFAHGVYAGQTMFDVQLFTGALALVVLLYTGWPFLVGTWRAARVGRMTMDSLVVLGTWTAWLYSLGAALTHSGPTYFESAAMITTIVAFGRWLEALASRDAVRAAAGVGAEQDARAWKRGTDGETEQVSAADVAVGDELTVRAGERIPVDGVVLGGESDVDTARLTGEPLPVAIREGDEVFAGAINLTGLLTVRAMRVGPESLEGRFAAIVEDAAFAKASAQRLADTVAGIFVPAVVAIAVATFAITIFLGLGLAEGVMRAVAVLVVACPCALGLAVPLAVINAGAAGAKRGMAVRGGPALERAGDLKTVAFDKTGTLTMGSPRVVGWIDGAEPGACDVAIALAAAVEAGDPHPAATAIALAAVDSAIPAADGVERVVGRGIRGRVGGEAIAVGNDRLMEELGVAGGSDAARDAERARRGGGAVVWVARDGQLLGGIVLGDRIRPEAAAVVAALTERGVRTVTISGDAQSTTDAVARQAGIGTAYGDVLPHEKETVVQDLRTGGALAFIGDGINDAAALAAADLAVTTADASDVSIAIADVVLPPASASSAPLAAIPALVRIAEATRRVVRENLFWAFTYNVVAVPLAALGLLSPIVAAAAMAFSSLAVVANSWRLSFAGGRLPSLDHELRRAAVVPGRDLEATVNPVP